MALLIRKFAAAIVGAQLVIAQEMMERPVLFLLGDSLTERGLDVDNNGWAALLQYEYAASGEVVTRGAPGYNTKWFLKISPSTVEYEITHTYKTPSLITVWFGTNDASLTSGYNAHVHVPIADYKKNLQTLVSRLQTAAPYANILLITPPPINEIARAQGAREINASIDRTNAVMTQYAQACVETARNIGVQVLDINSYFNAMDENLRNTMLSPDGLHLASSGNLAVFQQLNQTITESFPDVAARLNQWQILKASNYAETDPWTPADGE